MISLSFRIHRQQVGRIILRNRLHREWCMERRRWYNLLSSRRCRHFSLGWASMDSLEVMPRTQYEITQGKGLVAISIPTKQSNNSLSMSMATALQATHHVCKTTSSTKWSKTQAWVALKKCQWNCSHHKIRAHSTSHHSIRRKSSKSTDSSHNL